METGEFTPSGIGVGGIILNLNEGGMLEVVLVSPSGVTDARNAYVQAGTDGGRFVIEAFRSHQKGEEILFTCVGIYQGYYTRLAAEQNRNGSISREFWIEANKCLVNEVMDLFATTLTTAERDKCILNDITEILFAEGLNRARMEVFESLRTSMNDDRDVCVKLQNFINVCAREARIIKQHGEANIFYGAYLQSWVLMRFAQGFDFDPELAPYKAKLAQMHREALDNLAYYAGYVPQIGIARILGLLGITSAGKSDIEGLMAQAYEGCLRVVENTEVRDQLAGIRVQAFMTDIRRIQQMRVSEGDISYVAKMLQDSQHDGMVSYTLARLMYYNILNHMLKMELSKVVWPEHRQYLSGPTYLLENVLFTTGAYMAVELTKSTIRGDYVLSNRIKDRLESDSIVYPQDYLYKGSTVYRYVLNELGKFLPAVMNWVIGGNIIVDLPASIARRRTSEVQDPDLRAVKGNYDPYLHAWRFVNLVLADLFPSTVDVLHASFRTPSGEVVELSRFRAAAFTDIISQVLGIKSMMREVLAPGEILGCISLRLRQLGEKIPEYYLLSNKSAEA